MAVLSPTSAVPCRPGAAALPRRIRQALLRWWERQCRQAERKNRFVPYY